MTSNIHTRVLTTTEAEVGALLDGLSGPDDRLWPSDRWPAQRFDRPLGVGADGGHGPIRYHVESYAPGRLLRCRFSGPRGFDGFQDYTVLPVAPGRVELRHLMVLRLHSAARLTFPLIFRPLHDALIEDLLDRAEQAITGTVARPARFSWYVRMLRGLVNRLDSLRRRDQ